MNNTALIDIAQANRRGEKKGILSVDSNHASVIEAYLLQALDDGLPASHAVQIICVRMENT